jgi:YhcH/YjgK/YiaL family protein
MIFDTLADSQIIYPVHHSFEQAFTFLRSTDLKTLPTGRINIDGDAIYALVQEYHTKPMEQGKWESHRRYIDIQYIVSGGELINYGNLSQMKLGDYETDRDFQPMTGEGQLIELPAGSFMVFFPQDAHMPGLAKTTPSMVKKIVVKCRF